MREQAFSVRQSYRVSGKPLEASALDGLHADALHKIGGGKSAAHARPTTGWQNVIAAADVVAERLRAPGAEEDCARCADFR